MNNINHPLESSSLNYKPLLEQVKSHQDRQVNRRWKLIISSPIQNPRINLLSARLRRHPLFSFLVSAELQQTRQMGRRKWRQLNLWQAPKILASDKAKRSLVSNCSSSLWSSALSASEHLQAAREAYEKVKEYNVFRTEGGESTDTYIHSSTRDESLPTEEHFRAEQAVAAHRIELFQNEKKFREWMTNNGLYSTEVSGTGLNCLINALIQHATGQYQKKIFKFATNIREKIECEFPNHPLMLNDDDKRTVRVLELVNEEYNTNLLICFVQANEQGLPAITSNIGDEEGNPVVIWNQAAHYVSLTTNYCYSLLSPLPQPEFDTKACHTEVNRKNSFIILPNELKAHDHSLSPSPQSKSDTGTIARRKKFNEKHPFATLPNELKDYIFSFLDKVSLDQNLSKLKMILSARTTCHFFNQLVLNNIKLLGFYELTQLSDHLCKILIQLKPRLSLYIWGIKTLLTQQQIENKAAINMINLFLNECLANIDNHESKKELLAKKEELKQAILRELSVLDIVAIDEDLLNKNNWKIFHETSTSFLSLFINLGIPIDAVDSHNWSVWHYVSYRLNLEAIKILINSIEAETFRDKINAKTLKQRTPLYYAISGLPPNPSSYQKRCCLKIVEILMKNGADPTLVDTNGISPINLAQKRSENADLLAILDPNNIHLPPKVASRVGLNHTLLNYETTRDAFYEIGKLIDLERVEIENIQKAIDKNNNNFFSLFADSKSLLWFFPVIKFAPKKADEILKILLKNFSFKKCLKNHFYKLILMAIHENNQENAIAILLHANLDAKQAKKYFRSILREAEEKDLIEIMYFLFEKAPFFCLHQAVDWGNHRMLQLFLNFEGASEHLNEIYKHNSSLLHLATLNQDLESMRILLAQKSIEVDIRDQSGWTPLHNAVLVGNEQCINLLLERGADPCSVNNEGKTPWCLSLVDNNPLFVTSDNKKTWWHFAVKNDKQEIMRALVQNSAFNASFNDKDERGLAPMHLAAMKGHVNIVNYFTQHIKGIDINIRDRHYSTPLHLAAKYGHIEAVNSLISTKGIKFNAKDKHGNTPLHLAAKYGHIKIVKALLSCRAVMARNAFKAKNKDGKTALELATRPDIISLLGYP
ncbi:ankyrin repeat domain-containing protein [Candidatus Protochlamydia sp. R18]|uniref:ankyrin repeat domain-containing protein n=1 Tax=Candidatus Protochlamydia sp. R18 TaxID=1353977 RepID=UPI0005A9417D|nr:ankyrin repeat domain-containing protein [Candidatus Protochlamydia sp. R18]